MSIYLTSQGIEWGEKHILILSSFTSSEFSKPWKLFSILVEPEQTTKMNHFSSSWYAHRYIMFLSACLDAHSYCVWSKVMLFTNPFKMKKVSKSLKKTKNPFPVTWTEYFSMRLWSGQNNLKTKCMELEFSSHINSYNAL